MVRELTVILNADGVITAVQVRGADGVARGLAVGDLPAALAEVNEAALVCVGELAAVRAELDAYKARGLQAAKAVAGIVDNPALTPEQKASAIRAVAQDIQANERERKRIAALAELAKAQAALDALSK